MNDAGTNGTGNKIKPVSELAKIISELKQQGNCVVHCHGIFDLVHPGKIQHLEAAKREGDVLVVTVARDEHVYKQRLGPVFRERLRAESVAALQCVDYVAVSDCSTTGEIIHLLQPNVFVREDGRDPRQEDLTDGSHDYDERQAIQSVGGRLHSVESIFSSLDLIDSLLHIVPRETEEWLANFKKRYTADVITGYLKRASKLRALVVGEAIIDEYVFCDGLGKSSKDPILAFQYRWMESYAGGSLAVANHLAGFCDHVGIVTFLGDLEPREDFVRRALLPNVAPYLLTRRGSPTIHKRRFIDNHTSARMLELYVMDDAPVEQDDEANLVQALDSVVSNYDVVIVADYGHGMMTTRSIASLCQSGQFLAVNTQANAGNRGFNTISKYPRADYVCLAGHEVSLETRMRHASWQDLVIEISKRIDCERFTVTLGKGGSLHYQPSHGFIEAPALATRVSDRVGAGDAVLAVTSLLVAQDAPWDIVGFLGNVVGAQMVAELGNRVAMNSASTARHISSLLKQL